MRNGRRRIVTTLTGDRSIPFTTYAKFIVDTATSLGQGGDKGFFKSQAQTHIAHALEMLYELKRPVTLLGAFELLSDRELLEEEMENLESLLETPRRAAVYAHFANRFLNQPDEQSGGVRETIGNYLQYFLTPEVAEVFCTEESTFDFAAIDQGKIILTTMPQKFQTERRYVNTIAETALLQSCPATLRQAKGGPRQEQSPHPLGRRSAAIHDRERRRHQRLQLRGCNPRSRRDHCRRRAKHDFIRAAARQRQIESANPESP